MFTRLLNVIPILLICASSVFAFDTPTFSTYIDYRGWEISYPSDWKCVHLKNSFALTDPSGKASITVDAITNVSVESLPMGRTKMTPEQLQQYHAQIGYVGPKGKLTFFRNGLKVTIRVKLSPNAGASLRAQTGEILAEFQMIDPNDIIDDFEND